MTINEIQDEIIEEFSEIEDWMDRYQLIIDLGEEGDVLPPARKRVQSHRRLPEPRLDCLRSKPRRHTHFPRRERRPHRQRPRLPAAARGQRPHPRGNSRCRPLFYSANRFGRKPFADAFQRIARHDQAHQGLCRCAQRLIRHSLFPLFAQQCAVKNDFLLPETQFWAGEIVFLRKNPRFFLVVSKTCTTFALANAKEVLLPSVILQNKSGCSSVG